MIGLVTLLIAVVMFGPTPPVNPLKPYATSIRTRYMLETLQAGKPAEPCAVSEVELPFRSNDDLEKLMRAKDIDCVAMFATGSGERYYYQGLRCFIIYFPTEGTTKSYADVTHSNHARSAMGANDEHWPRSLSLMHVFHWPNGPTSDSPGRRPGFNRRRSSAA